MHRPSQCRPAAGEINWRGRGIEDGATVPQASMHYGAGRGDALLPSVPALAHRPGFAVLREGVDVLGALCRRLVLASDPSGGRLLALLVLPLRQPFHGGRFLLVLRRGLIAGILLLRFVLRGEELPVRISLCLSKFSCGPFPTLTIALLISASGVECVPGGGV